MGNQKPVVIGEELEELGGPTPEHHGKNKEQGKSKKSKVEDEIKERKFKKDKQDNQDGQVEQIDSKKEDLSAEALAKAEEKPKKVKVGKAKIRSKKYQEVSALIDREKKYDVAESIELVKKTSLSKFDGNVEIHVRLLTKSGKPENVRGLLKYPHSTGKKIKVVILDEKTAEELIKTNKIDADIYITTPEMMPKIAKLAKLLGPKGKMPNPKSGTITKDPEKTKKELEGGQVEYKTDKFGNLHQVIGKVSTESKMLEENFRALLEILPKEKISSLSLCATMGPAVKVQL